MMKNARLAGGLAALAMLLILVTVAPAAFAADLPLVSSTTYASPTDDGFTCVTTGPDNAVYAAGYAQQNDALTSSVLLLVKYIDDGSSLTKAWHSLAGSEPMSAAKIAVDASGNVIVAANRGRITAFHGNGCDIVVRKHSPAGKLIWETTYDGPAHGIDYVTSLVLDAHGNAVVCGATFGRGTGRDYVTLKVTANGKRAWVRRYAGPSDFDEARGVAVDPAGNVYVTGQSRAKAKDPRYSGRPRAVTISYGPGGRQRWIRIDRDGVTTSGNGLLYGGAPGAKGIVLVGVKTPVHQHREHVYFANYRPGDGRLLWSRTPESGTRQGAWVLNAALAPDGAPVAAGYRDGDALLAGVSATGGAPWRSTFASVFSNPRWAEFDGLAVAADGRMLAAGETASGEMPDEGDEPTTFLVRYSPGLPVTAPLDYVGAGGASSYQSCSAVAIGPHGMYAVGKAAEGSGDSDAVLLKF
jgi:hypothetical protein